MDDGNEEGNAKKVKGDEKRGSAASPAAPLPHTPLWHSWTQLAGTWGEEHDVFHPKNPQTGMQELGRSLQLHHFAEKKKIQFDELHSQSRAGIAASKEGTSSLGEAGRAGGAPASGS